MTLRTRLLSLMLSMGSGGGVTLVALNLNSLVATWLDVALERSENAGRQVQAFMLRRIETRAGAGTSAGAARHAGWRQARLGRASSPRTRFERPAGTDDGAIAIHRGDRRGRRGRHHPRLFEPGPARGGHDRQAGPAAPAGGQSSGRITAILSSRDDYETRVLLGVAGQKTPVFTIQILVSPALLRAAALPDLRNAGIASGVALAVAILLAYWSASLALRPLARISHLLDGMVGGKLPEPSPQAREDRELYAIESKLSLLGERFRDARGRRQPLARQLESVLEKLDAKSAAISRGRSPWPAASPPSTAWTGGWRTNQESAQFHRLALEMLRSQAAAGGVGDCGRNRHSVGGSDAPGSRGSHLPGFQPPGGKWPCWTWTSAS